MDILIRTIDRVLRAFAVLVLFSMMMLTFVDVVARGLFNNPFGPTFELIELMLVILIFSAFPLASRWGAHITLDLIDGVLSPPARRALDRVVNLLIFLALLGVAWLLVVRGGRLMADGLHSPVLALPYWPVAYYMAAMLLIAGLIHLLYALTQYRPLNENAGLIEDTGL